MVIKFLFSIITFPISLTFLLFIIKSFNFLFPTKSLFIVTQLSFEIKRICFVDCWFILNLTISKVCYKTKAGVKYLIKKKVQKKNKVMNLIIILEKKKEKQNKTKTKKRREKL